MARSEDETRGEGGLDRGELALAWAAVILLVAAIAIVVGAAVST